VKLVMYKVVISTTASLGFCFAAPFHQSSHVKRHPQRAMSGKFLRFWSILFVVRMHSLSHSQQS